MSFSPDIVNDDHLQYAENTLNDDEGFVQTPYQDTKGIWTVGYGFNLQATPMPRAVANLWKTLLVEDIDAWLSDEFSYYDDLSDIRKAVLINMTYQMGQRGISLFKKMHKALMSHDYENATKEMKDSQWYRNHRLRGDRLVYMMRFNQYATREGAKSYYTNQ